MSWSFVSGSSEAFSNLTSASATWDATTASTETWSATAASATTWTDNTTSNTTHRNTSRFILLQPVLVSSTSGINFSPFVITSQVGIYGPSFYVSDFAPIALNANGDSLL